MTEDGRYIVNVMPGEGYVGANVYGEVNPVVGSYTVPVGTLFEVKSTGLNGGKFLRWKVSDFQAYTDPNSTCPRLTTDNPLILHCEGVDSERFNLTYRIFWVNAEFEKPSSLVTKTSLITKIGKRLGIIR